MSGSIWKRRCCALPHGQGLRPGRRGVHLILSETCTATTKSRSSASGVVPSTGRVASATRCSKTNTTWICTWRQSTWTWCREVESALLTIVRPSRFATVMAGTGGGHGQMTPSNATTPALRWQGSAVRMQWPNVFRFRVQKLESCTHNFLVTGAKCWIVEYGRNGPRNTTRR